MNFQDLHDLPPWVKTSITLLLGAGGARLLAVVLENRRLSKKEYRDTLLNRIRELEEKQDQMYKVQEERSVTIARLEEDLEECKRLHAQAGNTSGKA